MDVRRTAIYGSIADCNPLVSSSKGSILLSGKSHKNRSILSIDSETLSKHMLLIGGTGSGKTNVFNGLIGQIQKTVTPEDVIIVFDTKGDYAKRFKRNEDIVITNSDNDMNNTYKWNIFREILFDGWDEKRIDLNIQEISWTIYREVIEKSKDSFFPNAARDLFASILQCIIYAGKEDAGFRKENFNNYELKRAVLETNIQEVRDMLMSNPATASVVSYIGDGENGQALGVYAEMLSAFRRMFIGAFAERGSFSMRNFVREKGGKTLFIEYDLAIGNVLAPIYSILFDLALKEALGRRHTKGNVYLICDEFRLLPYLQHIDDGVNFGRSLGVKIIAGLQSINQLTEVYQEARGKNIAAGFSTIIAFRANDSATREYITGLFGRNMIQEEFRTITNSIREERRIANVVEDWDINSLKIGEAIVGLPFEDPFRFQFDLY